MGFVELSVEVVDDAGDDVVDDENYEKFGGFDSRYVYLLIPRQVW